MAQDGGGSRVGPGSMRGTYNTVAAAVVICVIAGSFVVLAATGSFAPQMPANKPQYCPLDVSFRIMPLSPGTSNNSSSVGSYAPGSVAFSADASGCVPPYTFAYSFGDGTSARMAEITHVYPGAGYFSGSLVVTASTGYSSSSFFCVNAASWPNITVGLGNPAPPCP